MFDGTSQNVDDVRRTPPNSITFYKSLQQVVASRDFVHYAVYGAETKLVMLYLANVLTADEMLLPTLIHVSSI